MAKQKRRIYCKFCDFFCYEPEDYVSHLEKHHDEMIPQDMTPWQFSYYLRTGKQHGSCIVCKKETSWNEKTHKYNRFCKNPKCKEKYREVFKNRMISKYGKTHLLNDPEQQKKMLSHRKISGKYLWRDHVTVTTYTGSYEKSFLEFLDQIMNFDPSDIMAPSPHTYYYEYEGEKHFYIPDFFIPSLDLEIEIKDGGDNANKHPKIQAVDKVKEKLKDEVMMKNQFNYIKITNKDNKKFFDFLNQAKYNYLEKDNKPIYMIEKELTLEDLNKLYTESFNENKITYSKSFSDIKNIVDSLSKKELHQICNGTFKDSPYTIYRNILLCNGDPASFIEVYNLKDEYSNADGCIVIACKEKYRKRGFTTLLINKMKGDKSFKWRHLVWECAKNNISSITLAKKLGLKLTGNNDEDYEFSLYKESSFIYETNINSKLDSNFKKKEKIDLNSLKKVKITSNICKQYSSRYKFIKHLRIQENTNGFFFINDEDEILSTIVVETKNNGEKWIQALEINKKFQGHELGKQTLNFACKDLKADHLSVNKNNKIAVNMYEKYGFKKYDETDNMIFMSISNIVTESSFIYETSDKSKLDSNFKKKSGINFKTLNIHSSEAQKYLKDDKYYNKYFKSELDITEGDIIIDEDNDKLAGVIYVGAGDKNKNRNYGFIETLEVNKKYRGYGLSNILLDNAIKKYEATDLVVYNDNEVAINLYKKHGFVIIGYGNDKNKKDYWMKLRSKLSKDDTIMMESLDTLLTTSPFEKELTLFHGSDKILNTIKPVRINVGNKLDRHARLSSFWGDDFEWCKYWALGTILLNNGCKLLFNKFLGTSRKYDRDFVVVNDNFNEVVNKIKDKNIYVYTKTIDKKYVSRGHTPAYSEYTIDIPVKPDSTNEYTVKEIIGSYTFELLSENEYKELLKIVQNDVLNTKPIKQFYKYSEYEKRNKLKSLKSI